MAHDPIQERLEQPPTAPADSDLEAHRAELEAYARQFDSADWRRGRELQAHCEVIPVEHDAAGRLITAHVDERPELHTAYLEWDEAAAAGDRGTFQLGDCSCSQGINCHHVAAALHHALLGPGDPRAWDRGHLTPPTPAEAPEFVLGPGGPSRSAMAPWLEMVRRLAAEEPPLAQRSGAQRGLLYALAWQERPWPGLRLDLRTAAKGKHLGEGCYAAATPFEFRPRHHRHPPKVLQGSDQEILELVRQGALPLEQDPQQAGCSLWLVPAAVAPFILEAVLATGRAYWQDPG